LEQVFGVALGYAGDRGHRSVGDLLCAPAFPLFHELGFESQHRVVLPSSDGWRLAAPRIGRYRHRPDKLATSGWDRDDRRMYDRAGLIILMTGLMTGELAAGRFALGEVAA